MRFINNTINDIREIKGFNKEEILEIKRRLTQFKSEKSDQAEIDDFLKIKFPSKILEFYSNYFEEIRIFIDSYLIRKEETELENSFNYPHLKSGIINEIKLISDNLSNLKSNGRNTKRFLKNNVFLDGFLTTVQNLLDKNNDLISILENSLIKIEGIYDDITYIWIESQKIKNKNFKINELSDKLRKWVEIIELYDFLVNVKMPDIKKKKKSKKGEILTSHFNDIYQFYNKKQDGKMNFYSDLILILFQNKIIERFKEGEKEVGEFVNVLERKEIIQKLKKFMSPIMVSLIEDKLKVMFDEIIKLDEDFKLEDDKKKINLKTLIKQKISVYLPKITDYYLIGLEKKFQAIISNLKEHDEFKNISNYYLDKVNIFYSLTEEIENYITKFEPILKPYEEITESLKKILENVLLEITRRKDEYLYYLKTIKRERLRDSVRNFIYEKTSQINNLMNKYQDEISIIVREEFPQLKRIRKILDEYKVNIQKTKNEVYKKLDLYKEKDIDIYQIIKQWEDNFNLKRHQLSFLLSMILNKLFKNFKELIEEEEVIFDNIAEITKSNESTDNVPLNFALSDFLVDKLTEEELDERIAETNLKIKNLNRQINLYQSELSRLEETIANKVKIRTGISKDNVKCGVCHKLINLAKDKLIKCPFCDAVYHYLCVAFWLSKYNSCPACQNVFLDPSAGIYEDQEEENEER